MREIVINLDYLLKEKQVSKRQLRKRCGLQSTQLNNYCKNKITRVDLHILSKICDCLDCTPNDVLKFEVKEEEMMK